jgi:hypothetical protein
VALEASPRALHVAKARAFCAIAKSEPFQRKHLHSPKI